MRSDLGVESNLESHWRSYLDCCRLRYHFQRLNLGSRTGVTGPDGQQSISTATGKQPAVRGPLESTDSLLVQKCSNAMLGGPDVVMINTAQPRPAAQR